jgi:PAS domain S-box-containing protein
MSAALRSEADYAFLSGGGELGRLIAGYDWASTPIGAIETWPEAMKAQVSLFLRSPVAIVTLWGEQGVMLYNDAYSAFAGRRHPQLLGSNVREGWPEVADFNDNIMRVCLAGGTLAYRNAELVLDRRGSPESVRLDLDYSPLLDARGVPTGVIAIVVDITEKFEIERALEAERQLLTRAQEAGGVGVFTVDITANTISGSPQFFRIYGLPEATVADPTAFERLTHADDRDIASTAERRRTGEAMVEAEYRIHRADTGEERVIARRAEYERDDAGRPIRLVGAVQDITERRATLLALAASEAQFRTMAQAVPNQIWSARPDGALDWFNDRVYDYFGAAPGELDGDGWTRHVHPEDAARVGQAWAEAHAHGHTYEAEFRIRRADGAWRWHLVRALPSRNADGEITRWLGANTDIHEQKLAEVENIRDRNRMWAMTRDLLLVCDLAGVITTINPSATRLLGWTAEEMIGRPITDFIHPDDVALAAAEVEKLGHGTTTLHFENRYRAKDGSWRLMDWTAVPEGDRIHGVGRDITEQRHIEEALRQSQKMEAVGQLTGGIAHDFNNLLQGITGSLDLVQKRISQGRLSELDRFITGAMTSANRASALTHRLLAFSRRQPLDPRPVRANPLMGSMEDLLRRTLGERIELELVTAGGLWLTRCDPNQLESAILNLVINARDAMPDGGKLTIETCNAHLDALYAAKQREVRPGQYVCICVTDTGTGMTPETMKRAFEPFFTTKPLGQGTGLGLSMIYGFAQQSEGFAKIYSEVGKGTTFKLYLPRWRGDADEEDAGHVAAATATQHGETVLVVEDEPVVRGLIVEVLNDLGYNAMEAADGPSGLEILQSRRKIDLLVTDIGLPGLNGRQVADAARTLRKDLKVLFMTGYAENAALAAGFLEPGMAMITKPFAMEVLAARIREIIEGD